MTTSSASSVSSVSSASSASSASSSPTPLESLTATRGHVDDVGRLVAALVPMLSAQGACLLHRKRGRGAGLVTRLWPVHENEAAADYPTWVNRLPASTWEQRRFVWRAGKDLQGAATVVPVLRSGAVRALLVFHGPRTRPPDSEQLGLLEVVAQMAARSLTEQSARTEAGQVAAASVEREATRATEAAGLQQAMSLVDVFAFTVRVRHDDMEWHYFGPNSTAVFGDTVTDEWQLPDLLAEHAHPEDSSLVDAFVAAVREGRREELELRTEGLDGVCRWVSWRAVPRHVGRQLFVDGVATDVSARHSLGRSRRELEQAKEQYSAQIHLRRQHAVAVRDANDNVLQRLFAAGLRLQMMSRRLDSVAAHAASAIGFQLDQAVSDLRQLILELNAVIEASEYEDPA